MVYSIMPIYSFFCEHCNNGFEVHQSIDKAGIKPKCPNCLSKRQVYRDYLADNISVSEGPKTIGSLADRNGDKHSEDQKEAIRKKILDKK